MVLYWESLLQIFLVFFPRPLKTTALEAVAEGVLGRREGSVLPAVRPFPQPGWLSVNWRPGVRGSGGVRTKIVFAKTILRHRLWQVRVFWERREWTVWIQLPCIQLPGGCAPGALPHYCCDLMCPFRICFWLLCVKISFSETNCIPAQTIRRNAVSDTKSIWGQLLYIHWLSSEWCGKSLSPQNL